MQLRLPMIGTGKRGDPFRVELPSYETVEVNYAERWAIVDVPEADLPQQTTIRRELVGRANLHRKRGSWPVQRALDAWHAHLDERYREHAGRFRPIPD